MAVSKVFIVMTLFVVTGATYGPFPADDFEVFDDGGLKLQHVYPNGFKMKEAVTKHKANFDAHQNDHILRPVRTAKPDKVKAKVEDMRMPTGYFKLVFRPANSGQPAALIGFLLPHSFENLNLAVEFFENVPEEDAFWFFVSTPRLIEEASGMTFPGIPESMKDTWGDDFGDVPDSVDLLTV